MTHPPFRGPGTGVAGARTRVRPGPSARRNPVARGRRDDGQMATPLVLFLGFTVLAFITIALVPVGAATNERSRSQTAADAAALAGAEHIRTAWVFSFTAPKVMTFPLGPPPASVTSATGSGNATSYASSNGSQVTSYSANPASGRVFAAVQSIDAAYPEHGRAVAESTVEMDADFATCTWDDPTPPTPLPAGPPTFVRTLECGAWSATYQIANVSSGVIYPTLAYVGDTREALFRDLEPRIVD